MSKTRPRVVLVGAGGYGRLYVEALTSQDMGAELTAICDIDPNLAERVPQIRQRQIPVYPTLDAFFAKDSADLAVLVSPVHFHTDMVLSCLEHGVNVLCEKPLCLTVKEAAAMQEASKKTGKFLCIGYQQMCIRDRAKSSVHTGIEANSNTGRHRALTSSGQYFRKIGMEG